MQLALWKTAIQARRVGLCGSHDWQPEDFEAPVVSLTATPMSAAAGGGRCRAHGRRRQAHRGARRTPRAADDPDPAAALAGAWA